MLHFSPISLSVPLIHSLVLKYPISTGGAPFRRQIDIVTYKLFIFLTWYVTMSIWRRFDMGGGMFVTEIQWGKCCFEKKSLTGATKETNKQKQTNNKKQNKNKKKPSTMWWVKREREREREREIYHFEHFSSIRHQKQRRY